MWKSPPYPLVYEINAWPWLQHLSSRAGRPIDLGNVPEEEWAAIAEAGFDAVWLMGVWARSPAGEAIALGNADLRASFEAALPGYRREDVVGSPYCIRDYVVDEHLGGTAGLASARTALARVGLGLLLDFVPNHVAPDHPWTTAHPDRFIRTSDGAALEHGRDPYFPAWPDVVQLNAFSADLRTAVVDTLRTIADQCDGVRCDMAMLVTNEVFERTWGDDAGDRPHDDYWTTVIPAVQQSHPGFLFIAETYWDMEWELQQQGFDFCYDKRLYDRLLHEGADSVRSHLLADDGYQAGLLRFVENHDEPRIASLCDARREKALAVATLTQMGCRLVHHGQAEGWRVRLPVFLGRFPDEPTDPDLAAFHRSLAGALSDPTFRHGRWQLCEREGWPGNDSFQDLVAWCWDGESRWLVVVNLSDTSAAGRVRAPWNDLRDLRWHLVDPTNGVTYDRDGDELTDGLYVELGPWRWHLFRVEPSAA